MQLVRGIHNIQASDHGCVLTIGNFDGVHLGHQRVISALVAQARLLNCTAAVMVFEPQPRELFAPETAPARLTRLRDKYKLIAALGVDRLICVNFDRSFANQSAQYFIEHLLVSRLGIKKLIIGDDFHFGRNRIGNFELLTQAGKSLGFDVESTASLKLADCRISSTRIRNALNAGELTTAQGMLGRPYSVIGKVFHGDKRGREIGFPTANVLLKRRVSPISGVYIVQVKLAKGIFYGVANVGSRPTVSGTRQQVEVHIFNFNEMIYGQQIEVVLINKLRNEIKFASVDALQVQINKDSLAAKSYLENLNR